MERLQGLDSLPVDQDRAVVTVGASGLPEIGAFCARWELTVRHTARHSGRWAVIVVEGSPQLVRGFTEITSLP